MGHYQFMFRLGGPARFVNDCQETIGMLCRVKFGDCFLESANFALQSSDVMCHGKLPADIFQMDGPPAHTRSIVQETVKGM